MSDSFKELGIDEGSVTRVQKDFSNLNKLPIAEVFNSIQGEGYWVGTPMRFIRLAGCPVGKKATQEFSQKNEPDMVNWLDEKLNTSAILPVYPSKCQTWDGRFFDCDTNFSVQQHLTVDELLSNLTQKHICLTGGEPLIHQKRLIELGFFQTCFSDGVMVHIETSGTVELDPRLYNDKRIWISVAPKWDVGPTLDMADEVKLLVDENFNIENWYMLKSAATTDNVFLCPINSETSNNQENIDRCIELLDKHPTWRLSCQWHKFLGLR